MSQPKVTDKGTQYEFMWDEYKLICVISGLREHKDGRITCIVKFTTNDPEYHDYLLEQTFNLLGTNQTKTLLKNALIKVYPVKVDWDSVIGQICGITLSMMRSGEPVHEVWTDDKVIPLEYTLYPILPEGEPTLLFADGGSGKSSMGLFIATCIALPWTENPLGFKCKFGKPLYLDWETKKQTFTRRISWIRRGHNLPEFAISYRRCSIPLADDINTIHALIKEHGFDFIIIDSVIGAAKGNVNDSEVAQEFFRGVRRLNVTSLIIHHTAKETLGRNKSPFGSAYFTNEARSVWELSKDQNEGDTKLNLMLSHYKANDDVKHAPIGINIEFNQHEGRTSFRKLDINNIPDFDVKQSLGKRILNQLKKGRMSITDLSEQLNEPTNKIRARLSDLHGMVTKLDDGSWALVQK